MKHFRTSDIIAASAGGAAGITLAQINVALTTLSISLGIAYLIWKWRRESKHPPRDPR
jgi:hypothetical protein